MPQSTATRRPSASTKRFPGCKSAWKNPSPIACRRKDWISRIVTGGEQRCAVGQRDAVDPFDREHAPRRALPIDGGHAKIEIVLGVFGKLGKGRGF
jgi:hypothetical protein